MRQGVVALRLEGGHNLMMLSQVRVFRCNVELRQIRHEALENENEEFVVRICSSKEYY